MSYDSELKTGLAAIDTSYEVMVKDLFGEQMPGNYGLYADIVPTNSVTKQMNWIGPLPLMRKWVGARIEKAIRSFLHSMSLDKYEVTLPIQRMDLAYDTSGAIAKRLSQFLQAQAPVYDLGASAKLVTNPTGYDGVAIFSASHPFAKDGGLNSNYSTNPLTRANYEAARVVMQTHTDEFGRNVSNVPDTIIVGPALEAKAKEIFEAKDRRVTVAHDGTEATQFGIGATQIQNIWEGELNVVVDPNFVSTYAYYWILLNTKIPGVRPVIILEGRKPEAHNQDQMTDPRRFTYDEFVYGLEGDFSFNAGFWQVAHGNLATS